MLWNWRPTLKLCIAFACLGGCNSLEGTHGSWLEGSEFKAHAPAFRKDLSSAAPELFPKTPSSRDDRSPAFATLGSGRFTANSIAAEEAPTKSGEPGVTLNLVNVPIGQAAKTVLGDLLNLNYVVDDRVQGAVTVQTTSPVSKQAMVDVFETVLRSRGAAIVEDAGFHRILPLDDARVRLPGLKGERQGGPRPGLAIQVVPVDHVSAEEMRGILEPIAPAGGILRVDAARNLVIIAGTAAELASMRETVALFDVNWMKGMSFALHPLKSSEPEAVVGELDTVFATQAGPLKQMVKFVPNKRLNAVLVISARPQYLAEAATWIARLDRVGSLREDRMVVYPVHNRAAADLAPILQSVFGNAPRTGPPAGASLVGAVAPALEPVTIRSDGAELIAGPAPEGTGDGPPQGAAGGVSIVADPAENALVVYASGPEHERFGAMLAQLDRMPTQVLLEATIAEVTLGDDLNFGLRWFFESGSFTGTMTDVATGGVSSVFPGFSYLFSTGSFRSVLNALSSVTDVKIVSSPTLMVLDNKEAMLQVGDQVPIVTQTARSTADPDAPIVNSVEMKDTGVILKVRPHVNDSGRVVLDIEQEVSSVVETTTSGIDSPTIRQRKLSTTVVVADGESLALGGLIQDRDSLRRSKLPVLGDVPGLGNVFRRKESKVERTELIVFIQPRVVHDVEEARMITEEYRSQLSLQAPDDRGVGETMKRDFGRTFR